MARLNESAAPVESLETLKRRFVRQNREIARVNSIQSLRIRSLESEVSHLLSENVSLREQVIALGQELERFEAAKLLSDGVHGVRAKLENKLAELSTLVSDLGTLPRKFNKSQDKDGENSQSPSDQGRLDIRTQAPNVMPNLGIEDGRLPVILEDKHYPRKTLEFNEPCGFDNDDDVTKWTNRGVGVTDGKSYELSPEEKLSRELNEDQQGVLVQAENCEADEASVTANFETRRKKRSSASLSKKSGSGASDTPGVLNGIEVSPRPGTKRKFSSDDSCDGRESIPTDDDDFQFTRPSHSSQAIRETPKFIGNTKPPERSDYSEEGRKPKIIKRKALEPKSTNLHISSPEATRKAPSPKHCRKITTVAADLQNDQNRNFKPTLSKERHSRKEKAIGNGSESDSSRNAMPEDLIAGSTGPDEPLTEVDRLDTTSYSHVDPPPRPTRRQRAVVSYAEPNLRDKMRRPTNEFIAAVANDQARRKSSTLPSRGAPEDELDSQRRDYKGSGTSQDYDSMVVECDSRFGSSSSCSRHAMAMVSQRKRKALSEKGECLSIPNDAGELESTDFSPPGISGYQGSGTSTVDSGSNPDYLGGTSATNACVGSGNPNILLMDISRATPNPVKTSRRHSSNPTTTGRRMGTNLENILLTDCVEESAASSSHESSIKSNGEKKDTDGEINMEPSKMLVPDQRQAKRGQRAAARRRSMML